MSLCGQGDSGSAAPRFAVLAAITVATWLPIVVLYRLAGIEGAPALGHAEFVEARGDVVPGDDDAWRVVSLPDDWRRDRPGTIEGWYRFRIDRPLPDDAAVYLPVVAMNAAVYWNGRRAGDGGRFGDPVSRNWNRPLLFPLSGERTGTLHIRVKSDLAGSGFLPRVQVGSRAELEPLRDRANLLRRSLLVALIVARLVVAAATAAIWLMWRKEAYYGWFAACIAAWVVAELDVLVVDIPTSTSVWYWIHYAAIGWWGLFAVRLVLDFVGARRPFVEKTLFRACAAGTLILGGFAATGSAWLHPLAVGAWLPGAFAGASMLLPGVMQRLYRQPDEVEFNVVFIVTASVLGCVLFDLLMQLGVVERGGLNVPSLSSPVAIAGMGWVLSRRFLRVLRETEALAVGLEARVREREREIEQSYARLDEAERNRLRGEERGRVFKDMHEGIGSKLVSALAAAERSDCSAGTLGATVRGALDDLRILLDSLDPAGGELLPALAALRTRMEPRMAAAGINVEWRVRDLPPIAGFGPEELLRALHIAQEVFAAAFDHGEAGKLTIRTGVEWAASGLVVVVEFDDSVPPSDATRRRHEVMRGHAAAMHATLDVHDSTPGVCLRLSIPCAAGETRRWHELGMDKPLTIEYAN